MIREILISIRNEIQQNLNNLLFISIYSFNYSERVSL